jgi:hypothetical protein
MLAAETEQLFVVSAGQGGAAWTLQIAHVAPLAADVPYKGQGDRRPSSRYCQAIT